MILNDIKIAYRNLNRNRGYSTINISGLAVGMAVTMLIGLWVYDEITFNHYHDRYRRIGQVFQHLTQNDEIITAPGGPYPLAAELRNSFDEDFKHVVSAWWESNHILSIDDRKTSQNGSFMDPEALEMFSFRMIRGDLNSLKDPSSMVLSASAAKALFGDEDPIGKNIRIDQILDVKITGVYEDIPFNSRFHSLHFVGTWEYWMSSNPWMKVDENNWKSHAMVFVELAPHTTFEGVSKKVKNIKYNKIPPEEAARRNPELFLHPMDQWHLFTEWKNGVVTGGRSQFVWLFGAIGAFVLLLACINFMNLTTAQSERRAKEVGIRKSIGSLRSQLVRQFLSESFVVVAFAFIVTLALVTTALPWFNQLTGKDLDILWRHPMFWLSAFLFIVITSALAGSYPAVYLSSFQPVKVLKGTFRAGKFASVPRKVLVTLQFSASVALIIGTAIVWQQIQFAKDRPIGYTREGLMMIRKTAPEFWDKFDVLRNALKSSGAIIEMAESSSPVTAVWFNNSGYHWKGKDPNLEDDFATMGVTHDYGRTMGWQFLKGRDFSRDFSTDSSAIILNEAAAKFMGLEDPINEEVTKDGKRYTVIGVIKDMVVTSPFERVEQTIFSLDYRVTIWANLRINPEISSAEAINRIEKVFRDVLPAVPFEYKFADAEYALKFASEERIGRLASIFASLAIFISCMGLFGMASFVAEQRKKEIGIRKILGASVANLWKMLSTEFVLLVVVSCVIAIPVTWYFLEQWLSKYEYRTHISPWMFLVVGGVAVVITLLTVSFQTIKASLANPVSSLRSE